MKENIFFNSAAISDRGLSEKRPVNEDSFLTMPEIGLFIVADGVGGAQAGDFASQMAVETIGEVFSNLVNSMDAEAALKTAIEHANQAIYAAAKELPQLSSMATTVAALHLSDNIATIAHVGDSRVYRIESDGTLYRETADHSLVEEEVQAGRLTRAEAENHPHKNIISRALGAEPTVMIDTKVRMIEPGTMFLLCSDGITRHIPDDELEGIFNSLVEANEICRKLKEICYARGAEDNLTAIVVSVATEAARNQKESPISSSDYATSELSVVSETQPNESIFNDSEISETVPKSNLPSPAIFPSPDDESNVLDLDEETIPTSRVSADDSDSSRYETQPLSTEELPVGTANFAESEAISSETTSPELNPFDELRQEEILQEDSPDKTDYRSESIVVPAGEPAQLQKDAQIFQSVPQQKGGFGRLLIPFLTLVIGLAAGYYARQYFFESEQPTVVPQITEMKSSNIPLTEYEDSRRLVDRSPEKYLEANAASPLTAEDHYLLGRALLLTGKYVEAKRQFLLAKEKINDAVETNAGVLATDIATGLALSDNPQALEKFKTEIGSMVNTLNQTNQSVNSNSSISAANSSNQTGQNYNLQGNSNSSPPVTVRRGR